MRLDEIYLGMLTFAFGMMVLTIVFPCREVTGGRDGMTKVMVADLGIPGLPIKLQKFANYDYLLGGIWAIATDVM